MDKISAYSGKQRKNSEGKCDPCACFPLKYVWQRAVGFKILIASYFNWNSTNDLSKLALIILFVLLLVSGPVEADPEYRLIVAANNLTVEIDNELSELAVHGFVYKKAQC